MENPPDENQPQPQNNSDAGVLAFLIGMEVFGLGIGLLIYYAENSVMGSQCSAPIYLIFYPLSIYLQLVPLFFTLELIMLLLPYPVTLLTQSRFHQFWLFVWFESIGLQAALNLYASLHFPAFCGSDVKDSGAYILFWILTGLSLLVSLGVLIINIGFVTEYCQNEERFYQSLGLGPWFDKKKRARVIQQLIRCAGTKEGCRLLAKEYCEELFRWNDIFNHLIVLSYISSLCKRKRNSDELIDAESNICTTCGECLRTRSDVFFTKLGPQVHHLSCTQRWDVVKWNQTFPNPRELVMSLEELAPG